MFPSLNQFVGKEGYKQTNKQQQQQQQQQNLSLIGKRLVIDFITPCADWRGMTLCAPPWLLATQDTLFNEFIWYVLIEQQMVKNSLHLQPAVFFPASYLLDCCPPSGDRRDNLFPLLPSSFKLFTTMQWNVHAELLQDFYLAITAHFLLPGQPKWWP